METFAGARAILGKILFSNASAKHFGVRFLSGTERKYSFKIRCASSSKIILLNLEYLPCLNSGSWSVLEMYDILFYTCSPLHKEGSAPPRRE